MDALAIINKYYPEDNELKRILLTHSRSLLLKNSIPFRFDISLLQANC